MEDRIMTLHPDPQKEGVNINREESFRSRN
jgi:hypothetical protein